MKSNCVLKCSFSEWQWHDCNKVFSWTKWNECWRKEILNYKLPHSQSAMPRVVLIQLLVPSPAGKNAGNPNRSVVWYTGKLTTSRNRLSNLYFMRLSEQRGFFVKLELRHIDLLWGEELNMSLNFSAKFDSFLQTNVWKMKILIVAPLARLSKAVSLKCNL